jgi:hypothetical protein
MNEINKEQIVIQKRRKQPKSIKSQLQKQL